MPSQSQSGSQLTVIGTEHVLGVAETTAGIYQLRVDTTPMADTDEVELRCYTKTLATSTERLEWLVSYAGPQTARPNKIAIPTPSVHSTKYTLKQTVGTVRTFDWSIVKL